MTLRCEICYSDAYHHALYNILINPFIIIINDNNN